MTTPPDSGIPDPDRFSTDSATRLLRLGLSGKRRPVDDLVDRLNERDGAEWLTRALDAGPLRGVGTANELLARGHATVAELTAIKERSKSILERAADPDSRLAGLAGYFLSIAAALRHHNTVIGGRGRAERDAVFLDLAAAAPSPYSGLLGEATVSDGADDAP